MTQSLHWSMLDHLWFYLCLFMFNNAYTHTPISQPANLRTVTLTITHVGWSMAHFPQSSQPRSSSTRVSLDPPWGLHSVEHKARIKKDETTRYSLMAVGWAAQDESQFGSWHTLTIGPSVVLIVHIFSLDNLIIINMHDLIKNKSNSHFKHLSLCFLPMKEPAQIFFLMDSGMQSCNNNLWFQV